MIRVLVADDHDVVRRGLRRFVEAQKIPSRGQQGMEPRVATFGGDA